MHIIIIKCIFNIITNFLDASIEFDSGLKIEIFLFKKCIFFI